MPAAALRHQCRPGPAGCRAARGGSIRTISEATGITFINDGPTSEAPSPTRAPYQKDLYGDRWAPLLIAWTTPEQAPQLKGPVIGTGGSTHFSFGDGPKSFVTGSLELDAPQIEDDLDRAEGAAYATAVILHELGHVMGLEHVDDPAQLMYPEIGAPHGLADGHPPVASTRPRPAPRGPLTGELKPRCAITLGGHSGGKVNWWEQRRGDKAEE